VGVTADGDAHTVETATTAKAVVPATQYPSMTHAHVVTCFLRNPATGRVLLTRRSDAVGTYVGRWAGVSGYVEGSPEDALDDARREIREETGLDATLVRAGDPLDVDDGDRQWTVHPFLFDASGDPADDGVTPNEELEATEWVHATTMLDRETVPDLWAAYRRVAPTAEAVAADRDHGSSWLSLRALEAIRDEAGDAERTGDGLERVASVARTLRDARPSMVVVENRVNRVLASADRTPDAVRSRAEAVLDEAASADGAAAAAVAERLDSEDRVATLSRSETVLDALSRVDCSVVVGESRPAREGVAVAERLADGREVTLTTDAALPGRSFDAAVLGADAVLPDGSVVNKVGTYSLALAAARTGVPCYVVTAGDKVQTDGTVHDEAGPAEQVYDGDAAVSVENPTFERVPADLVTVVTESGELDAADVAGVAATHRENARWDGA
jgi:translation initiation factor 2B subunit (eIF-2B alpha/beta/delta family)/isopentenyldiphosphate isomerase